MLLLDTISGPKSKAWSSSISRDVAVSFQ